ncbi:glycosyltransferase [Lysinibacillus yapensis]|uniref:Glycosyltransferase n=1 Tax=Ureibacillus yapensis TaxID=2304605 RepID=A0A396SGX3_9BACL|nr:WecB/TagA/CpsF family glycosyltransferase [Lysinibacillus yapensis]RHW39528.1 glycosyltransferase [Lysinibacillus yapensis]
MNKRFIEKELFLGTQLELVDRIVSNTQKKIKKAYYAINADCMLKYWSDEEYQKIINMPAHITYVDGMGIIFAQKFLKLPIARERIATTDLFPALVKHLQNHNSLLRIFLLGGKNDTAEIVIKNFGTKYPNVNFVGSHHGYFDKNEESNRVIQYINSLNVDILFVGFGNPIQEKWVNNYFDQLNVSTIITCGGLFDYYSNNVKRAPLILQKTGLEWFYRLLQEPKRLYKRYLFGNFNFIKNVFLIKLKSSQEKVMGDY